MKAGKPHFDASEMQINGLMFGYGQKLLHAVAFIFSFHRDIASLQGSSTQRIATLGLLLFFLFDFIVKYSDAGLGKRRPDASHQVILWLWLDCVLQVIGYMHNPT